MNMYVVTLVLLLLAISLAGRIVMLKGAGAGVPQLLSYSRYAAWGAFGFALAQSLYQAGLLG